MFLRVELTAVERKKVTTTGIKSSELIFKTLNNIVQTSYVSFFEVSADVAEI